MYIENFISYLKFEKRYSDHTLLAYHKDLEQFFKFVTEQYNINEISKIDHQIIRSWMVSLVNEKISSKSINRKLSSLKSYYKYLLRENFVSESPLAKITSPKINKRLPEFVGSDNMDILLDDTYFGENFTDIRNKLIIEIFYFTGMRLSELVNLKDTDVDIYNLQFKVLGKRNKERLIPFSNLLKNSILIYQEKRAEVIQTLEEQKGFFFVTKKGKRIYKKLAYRVVNMYLSKVSTLTKKSPHVLRHTFATHMLNNGADLNSIKDILGHANLAATQIYTHNTIEKLKTIYKQAHPRA